MEKKFLKLGVILTLVISISTKSNANNILNKLNNIGKTIVGIFLDVEFISEIGLVCDRYEKKTFIGIKNGKIVKATNFTEGYCGEKTAIGIGWKNGYCSCVDYNLGIYTDDLDDVIKNTINNEKIFNKKAILLAVTSFAWNAWNVWNNANAILNYLWDKLKIDFGDLNIDLEGVL